MARGLNRCEFIGNLGADPEVRYTSGGTAVCSMRIACSDQWKDRDGNRQERTEWVSLVLWGKLGEIAGEHLDKGRQVYVSGRMQTRKWQDQGGNDRYTTEVVVDQMLMLGGGGGGNGGQRRSTDGDWRPTETGEHRRDSGRQPPPGADDLDDNIPF